MQSHMIQDVRCPVCKKSLIDDSYRIGNCSSVKLDIEYKNTRGILKLCPVHESYSYFSSIEVPEREIVMFICPLCKTRLNTDHACNVCNAPVAILDIQTGGKLIICSRKGCKHHKLVFESQNNFIHHYNP